MDPDTDRTEGPATYTRVLLSRGRPEDMQGGHLHMNETLRGTLGGAAGIRQGRSGSARLHGPGDAAERGFHGRAWKKRPFSGQDLRTKSVKADSGPSHFWSRISRPKMDDFLGAVFRKGQRVGCAQGLEGRSTNGPQKQHAHAATKAALWPNLSVMDPSASSVNVGANHKIVMLGG